MKLAQDAAEAADDTTTAQNEIDPRFKPQSKAHTPQGARSTTADDAVSTAHRTTPHHYRDVVGTQ